MEWRGCWNSSLPCTRYRCTQHPLPGGASAGSNCVGMLAMHTLSGSGMLSQSLTTRWWQSRSGDSPVASIPRCMCRNEGHCRAHTHTQQQLVSAWKGHRGCRTCSQLCSSAALCNWQSEATAKHVKMGLRRELSMKRKQKLKESQTRQRQNTPPDIQHTTATTTSTHSWCCDALPPPLLGPNTGCQQLLCVPH